jgi:tRNA pseudouridine32 synthase/23S rRNA pseudouridine746 synthase
MPAPTIKNESAIPDIVYADKDIVVALKPGGLLAVPGRGADKQDCLSSRLSVQFGEIHIAHRLDQATSGLMVFARHLAALRHLHAQFRNSQVDKAYEAVVQGQPASAHFTIELPLSADWQNRPKQKVDWECGKPSVTHVEVQSFDAISRTSRLRLIPVTGRTHQLRVHLEALGHPIVGDGLYGDKSIDKVEIEIHFLHLHASELAFSHPTTGRRLAFQSAASF